MLNYMPGTFGQNPDFKKLIGNGAVIIDVRTPSEFNSGHISGSKNLPLDNLDIYLAELKELNKPVIAVCRSGARSGAAVDILKKAGIDAYNGGSWNDLQKAAN